MDDPNRRRLDPSLVGLLLMGGGWVAGVGGDVGFTMVAVGFALIVEPHVASLVARLLSGRKR